ncbi:RNA 2'-phosphotransferase [bacterium]|nr:RNA 2'-phosphotransferase [bacterium]
MIKNRTKVSKFMSLLLRHRPQNFGLTVDKYGFADFNKVFDILMKKFPGLEKKDVYKLIENAPNQRFQIKEGKIRARYGHSIEIKPGGRSHTVPEVLYHGTSPKNWGSIQNKGLKPGKRKFVHLSISVKDALRVGKRKDRHPLILKIDAQTAQKNGLPFWKEEKVYLTKEVPPPYISVYKDK